MARKTKEEAKKTKQAILKAALEVFTQKGFNRTTLSDVAKKAGCTRGAIYWHFADKTQLFKELHNEMEKSAGLGFDGLLDKQAQSLQEIKELFLYYISVLMNNKEYRDFYEMVHYKTEWSEGLECILADEKQKVDFLLKSLGKDLEALKKKGKVKKDLNSGRVAVALLSYVEGLIGFWFFNPQALPLNEWANQLLDDFLYGIAE